MSTHITGKLILAGDYTEDEQLDPELPLARVVIVMPKNTLRDVSSLPMFQEVTVIKTAELTALRARLAEWEAENQRCKNSVVEVCQIYPNVAEYVKQLEHERDGARREINRMMAQQRSDTALLEKADNELITLRACRTEQYDRIGWLEQQREEECKQKNAALKESEVCLSETKALRAQLAKEVQP